MLLLEPKEVIKSHATSSAVRGVRYSSLLFNLKGMFWHSLELWIPKKFINILGF